MPNLIKNLEILIGITAKYNKLKIIVSTYVKPFSVVYLLLTLGELQV